MSSGWKPTKGNPEIQGDLKETKSWAQVISKKYEEEDVKEGVIGILERRLRGLKDDSDSS